MALIAMASDLAGTIYSVDHDGSLFRNRHEHPEGHGALLHPGLGEPVGAGWERVTHLAATRVDGDTLLAGLRDGVMIAADVSAPLEDEWRNVPAPEPLTDGYAAQGVEPVTRAIFGGPLGSVHAITADGALVRHRFTGSAVAATRPAVVSDTVEPQGWGDSLVMVSNEDGVFFDVTPDGTLRFQIPSPDADGPARDGWQPLATAWHRYQGVHAAGAGRLYAIGSEGDLVLRRYTVSPDGTVALAPRQAGDVVGNGIYPWAGLAADTEGYCWPMSVSPGMQIDFKVGVRLSVPPDGVPMDPPEPVTYSVEFRRLRRMRDGKEAVYDEIMPTAFAGQTFTAPHYTLAPDWLEDGAGWANAFSLTVPDLPPDDPGHWRTGIYAARCTDSHGRDFYISFVVRSSAAPNAFAVLANTNTWNAYNSWGGYGKYTHTYPVPATLPFHRPHPGLTPDKTQPDPNQGGETLYGLPVLKNSCHLLRAELWVLGWLEDLGPEYACDMFSDQDLHEGLTGIGDGKEPRYQALILNTHPEYWTCEMYDRVKAFRDQGGSVVYLGGDGVYEAVELSENDAHMGIFPGLDRTGFPRTCSNEQLRLHCLMRTPQVGRPEHELLGVGFQHCPQGAPEGQPYVLQQEPGAKGSNEVLDGVQLHKGDEIGATSLVKAFPGDGVVGTFDVDGWEVDRRGNGTLPQAYAAEALLAVGTKHPGISGEMLCYRTDQGGVVFSAASLNFGGSLVVDSNLQRIVQNALDLCLSR